MWIMKVLLWVSVLGLVDSYAGPKNYGLKIHKHVIIVSEIGLENPLPQPFPAEDKEMVARD